MDSNLTVSRRSQILELLKVHGKISVSSMSDRFSVSEVTIRNDLARLEQKGLLIRARGGAFKQSNLLQMVIQSFLILAQRPWKLQKILTNFLTLP
jgi:DeoR/GlpR family transcriptional regulator of sugar metabolism